MIIGRKKELEKNHRESRFESISFKASDDEDIKYNPNIKNYVDMIMPCGIDALSPNHICIDGTYISTFMCFTLPYSVRKCFFKDIINHGEGVELYIRHVPVNKTEIIKDITQYLGYTKYKLSEGDNQVDSGLQQNAYKHSVYMKSKLAEGDDFWYINVLVKVSAESEASLEDKVRSVEGILAGKDIFYKCAQFRQLEAFMTTLPIEKKDETVLRMTERNILSSGLCSMYPFTASTLSDPDGVFMALNSIDHSQVIIDNFNTQNYENANIIIFGGSGSGKTFTTQMLAGRYRMKKIPVMMICPLKGYEYKRLCDNVGGNFIKFVTGSENRINIMDIRPGINIENSSESLLAGKIQKLKITFSLMIPGITEEQLELLEGPLIKTYAAKGITMDNESIYKENDGGFRLNPKIKTMPILEDAHEEISKVPELSGVAKLMEGYIKGSMSFFNGYTNIDIENLYTVCDISDLEKKLLPLAMFVILEIYMDRVKRDITQKKVIVLDELWRLISTTGNELAAEFVLELYKVIRGYGGSVIAATQDWQDCMALRDGFYGEGIVNNSSIKIVLKNQPKGAASLKPVLRMSEEEETRVLNFKRGEGLLYAGSNHLAVEFKPFELEKNLITTDRSEIIKYAEEGK